MKQALLKLHAAVFLWGFTGILGRGISLNEGVLVWYRIAITIATVLAIQRWRGELFRVNTRLSRSLMANGAVLAIHWVFFYGSIKYSNVSIGLTCLSASGLFTSFLSPIFNKSKIAYSEVLLGMLGIAGIYLIFHFDPQYKTGIILGLIACLLSCLYTIFSEKQVTAAPTSTVMLYQLIGGILILSLLMPAYLYYFPGSSWYPIGNDWLLLLVMSWACTIVAMHLSLDSLKHLSAFTQNLTLNMEPVYGIVLAFIIFKENKNLSQGFFIGFGLIALAVILQMGRVIKQRNNH